MASDDFIIGLENGLLHVQCQGITRGNADLMSIGPLRTYISKIYLKFWSFHYRKWWQFCLGRNVLTVIILQQDGVNFSNCSSIKTLIFAKFLMSVVMSIVIGIKFSDTIWHHQVTMSHYWMSTDYGGFKIIQQVNTEITAQSFKMLNPLRAKFFRENINISLHFMSFLHTNKTHVVEIPPRIRQGPAYSTWSISWLLMSWQRKELTRSHTLRVKLSEIINKCIYLHILQIIYYENKTFLKKNHLMTFIFNKCIGVLNKRFLLANLDWHPIPILIVSCH